MKALHGFIFALAATTGAFSAHAPAHDLDSRDKIQVACASTTLQIGAISRAVNQSRLWASIDARRQMLSLARQSCGHGATVVTFVPTDEERSCRTPPKWSRLCVDPAAKPHETP